MGVAEFFDLAKSSGKRSERSLRADFDERFPDGAWPELSPDLLLTEAEAEAAPTATADDDTPFIGPSVDGCEQTNRWDMQLQPPDILITNVSMLSAMLNREVEDPIFEQTRSWLEDEEDARFYLVLDELHLQRGAAGTEVAYLLRLLLDRIGLTSPGKRHKLRILASSASLPADSDASVQYLQQMFANLGLNQNDPNALEGWRAAIVPGKEKAGKYALDHRLSPLDHQPFLELLAAHGPDYTEDPSLPLATPLFAKEPKGELVEIWRAVCRALGITESKLDVAISAAAMEAAERLLWACTEDEDGSPRSRAQTTEHIASRVFGGDSTGAGDHAQRRYAVRGLMLVRGALDGLGDYLSDVHGPPAQSFRLHTFYRSIEGLYAPAIRGAGCGKDLTEGRRAPVGALTMDRQPKTTIDGQALRLFELVYCECCGELFFGGMRASGAKHVNGLHAELLPQEDNLAGLPDEAVSQRFEELSWDSYGLFWPGPATAVAAKLIDAGKGSGAWEKGSLDPVTGAIYSKTNKLSDAVSGRLLPGWYYRNAGKAGHSRSWADAGTHVPYACPECKTSYSGRLDRKFRLSPLRNFRAGFAKTTQLLATELFDAQRAADPNKDSKLVSFSDSRQDAAKAALDIERNHHQDLRRELLVRVLREKSGARAQDRTKAEADVTEWEAELGGATGKTVQLVAAQLQDAKSKLAELATSAVPIHEVLGSATTDAVADGAEVPPLVARMASLGVHPYDGAGVDAPKGQVPGADRPKYFPWSWLLEMGVIH